VRAGTSREVWETHLGFPVCRFAILDRPYLAVGHIPCFVAMHAERSRLLVEHFGSGQA
jgi:hypothetical protein